MERVPAHEEVSYLHATQCRLEVCKWMVRDPLQSLEEGSVSSLHKIGCNLTGPFYSYGALSILVPNYLSRRAGFTLDPGPRPLEGILMPLYK